MDKTVEIIFSFRKFLLNKIEELSVEDLNKIPDNSSNNIIWNLAHLNAVLGALCYKTAALPLPIEEKYFLPFLPGTKPAYYIDASEVQHIKHQLISVMEQLIADLNSGIFKSYHKVEKIESVYGIIVESVDDAIKYILHHEGIHFNAITNIMRRLEQTRSGLDQLI